jgi:hypothetical protein
MTNSDKVLDLQAEVTFLKRQLQQANEVIDEVTDSCTTAPAGKRQRPASYDSPQCVDPLDDDEMLDSVLSLLGPLDYLFTAAVCKRWKSHYIQVFHCKEDGSRKAGDLCTSYRSAMYTASRLKLALKGGLALASLESNASRLADDIAKSSLEPIAVVTMARLFAMKWNVELCNRASFYGKLELLQFLHEVSLTLQHLHYSAMLLHLCALVKLIAPRWLNYNKHKLLANSSLSAQHAPNSSHLLCSAAAAASAVLLFAVPTCITTA